MCDEANLNVPFLYSITEIVFRQALIQYLTSSPATVMKKDRKFHIEIAQQSELTLLCNLSVTNVSGTKS
jgi:hypothetical protein